MFHTQFEFEIPQKLVDFTNRLDSGAYGRKTILEDLEDPPSLYKLCYIIESLRGNKDVPLYYHILDLISNNFKDLDKINDSLVNEKYKEARIRMERGRKLIEQGEYYKGLLIIDAFSNKNPASVKYWDISPIFYSIIQKQEDLDNLPLYGHLILRGGNSGTLSLLWRFDKRLVKLKNDNLLDLRPIAREFGGEGHFNVVGFPLDLVNKEETLLKVKKFWTKMVQNWNLH